MGRKWFLLCLIILNANIALAQLCSNNFKNISQKCIQSKDDNMSDLLVTLKKAKGYIYFYKNNRGQYGKVHISGVVNNTPRNLKSKKFKKKIECVVYYKSLQSARSGSEYQEGDIGISFDRGEWNSHTLDLSGNGVGDLLLRNQDGYCVLESVNGTVFAPYKKLQSTFRGQGSEMVYYAAFFLVGLAVFLVAFQVFQDNSRYQASSLLDEDIKDEKTEEIFKKGIVLKYSRPFFKRYFSPIVSGMKGRRKIRDKYKRKIAAAGLTKALPAEDFYAFKLFLIIGFPIVFLALRAFLESDWPLIHVFTMGFLGYFYPDIWLGGEVKRRQEEIVMNMPFVVDMLALSIEAGLDFIAAIAKVLEKAPKSALVEEFEILLKEIKLGSSRAEALRSFSWRNDSIAISSFCATLISADSVGASIGPILKVLGKEMRQKKSADIEKKAAAASTKMLLPMMMFILPAIIIVIMAPMLLQLFS